MSGTSLDGIDLAYCHFRHSGNIWGFDIIEAETLPYPEPWKSRLSGAYTAEGKELFKLDHAYGNFIGQCIKNFTAKYRIEPDFISSHGHTVFHDPTGSGTLQIGNGHEIFKLTGIPVICDFRSLDISLGGQGAPLVPAGDLNLFREYSYCLNLGGFANISFKNDPGISAWDICPCNTVLNHFAKKCGFEFDRDGELGRNGKTDSHLLEELNNLNFYSMNPPKSLGNEFLENTFNPVLSKVDTEEHDIISTLYEHIAIQVSNCFNNNRNDSILVTGGGAKNNYLLERIGGKKDNPLIIPEDRIIDFKEALVFAFLGVLKSEGINNTYASVTGACRDSSGGVVYGDIAIKSPES